MPQNIDDCRKDVYRFLQNGNTTFDLNSIKGEKIEFKFQFKD